MGPNQRGTGDLMSLSSEILADTPTGYWPMTEASGSITDSVSGVVCNATPTPIYSVPNYVATGININSTGYFAKAGISSAFTWVLGTDITLEFCLKRNVVDSATRGIVGYRGGVGVNIQYGVLILTGSNILFDVGNTGSVRWTTGVNIADTDWHHIVLRHRGSDGFRDMWVDGRMVASATVLPSTDVPAPTTFAIGIVTGSTAFNGALSDYAVYNGKFLSNARIQAHWAQIQNRNSAFMAALM